MLKEIGFHTKYAFIRQVFDNHCAVLTILITSCKKTEQCKKQNTNILQSAKFDQGRILKILLGGGEGGSDIGAFLKFSFLPIPHHVATTSIIIISIMYNSSSVMFFTILILISLFSLKKKCVADLFT